MNQMRQSLNSGEDFVPGQTMADYVANRLRLDIIRKKIPPDSIITVKEIAERYNVSLMPVRDAFHTLKGERFLDVVPYKHVRVQRIDRDYVRSVYDYARVLECLLVEELPERGTEELFTELEQINDKIRHLCDRPSIEPQEFLQLNTLFHNTMYGISKNDVAKNSLHYYNDTIINALRTEYQVSHERIAVIVEEHDLIIQAARQRDLELLQKTLTKHCIDGRNDFLKNEL